MKKFSLLFITILQFTCFLYAQERPVKGIVTEADTGEPLIGVSVVVEGTTKGITTNLDGAYSINVNQGEVLVFQMVGMQTQKVTIGTQTNIDINHLTSGGNGCWRTWGQTHFSFC